MRNFSIFFFALVLLFSACKKDDDSRLTADTLHYDGDNLAAPQLPEGSYEAAAKFTFSKLQRFQGKKLYEINMYIESVPTNVEVKIYAQGTDETPGMVLYNADWNGLNANKWNDHTLTTPIDITGEDLWISVRFDHPTDMRSIGCDQGPADSNGDWLFDYLPLSWEQLRDYTSGEVDINWNIRGQVTSE